MPDDDQAIIKSGSTLLKKSEVNTVRDGQGGRGNEGIDNSGGGRGGGGAGVVEEGIRHGREHGMNSRKMTIGWEEEAAASRLKSSQIKAARF